MIQGCYTSAAIAALVKTPEDRSVAVRALVESLGGKMHGFWLAFGEKDFVGIAELPDSQAAAAMSFAASAGGAVHDFSTVELLTWSEGVKAFKKAGSAQYKPPTKSAK
jgi:uncharacterized protein with GYD domain